MSWIPIESNPEVMNKFLSRLGVPEKWQIVDVLSLDPDMLGIIPRPTLALILLYPTNDKYKQLKNEEEAKIKEKGQDVSPNIYFLKQVISNTCGTVALLHSVANNLDQIQLGDGFLKQFIDDTKSLTPEERGDALAKNTSFINAHKEVATEGQSQLPTEEVIHHFVAFVHKDGALYELDGSGCSFPINRGPTSPEKFVEDAARVLTDIMKKDPDEIGFTVCALAAKHD
uniref:Ubiquitin carboxyl-terminal hydrolase n=1 Tax=Riptortus pedestris TaxID=329032 RepID=R4WRB2_RIPPE|nr:ubiquitin carboxyl-terminal hydrolase isozyme L3 [Riptortus pedestris]